MENREIENVINSCHADLIRKRKKIFEESHNLSGGDIPAKLSEISNKLKENLNEEEKLNYGYGKEI